MNMLVCRHQLQIKDCEDKKSHELHDSTNKVFTISNGVRYGSKAAIHLKTNGVILNLIPQFSLPHQRLLNS